MGRSQETFSKKEKEKARDKKRKDKEKKKEERKANPTKGQSLATMLAYVDENGNLTHTPPDLQRKKEVSIDEIAISVSRQEKVAERTTREGVINSYTESKGYGFIKDAHSQQAIFFHKSGLIDKVHLDDKVSFQVENTPKGLSAFDIRKLS
ncbi:cold shock domain-containing protein [Spirosoma sp. BT702]|uniref:Cold shock domain-containing protein n=2 Tax=Spirosoma profusum TaxID=2771354 RepID=A0A927ASP0_9BACT|nr:cold shock domain-containing protein [Spirosoma profusum]